MKPVNYSLITVNESTRKAYLGAMGLDIYYPRVNLPGAKISPTYEFDSETLLQAEGSATKESPNNSRRGPTAEKLAASVQSITDSITDSKSRLISNNASKSRVAEQETQKLESEKQEQTLDEKLDTSADESSELRFALRYYKVNDSLAVLDEYPLQQTADAAKESIILLKNILKALGVSIDEVELRHESFNWPLVEGLTSNAGAAVAAKQALQGFIVGRQQQDGFKNLLVFAGLIDDLLIGPAAAADKRDYKFSNSDCFVSLTHSLQSMLSFPQLKKDVWHQLQALKTRIQANQ